MAAIRTQKIYKSKNILSECDTLYRRPDAVYGIMIFIRMWFHKISKTKGLWLAVFFISVRFHEIGRFSSFRSLTYVYVYAKNSNVQACLWLLNWMRAKLIFHFSLSKFDSHFMHHSRGYRSWRGCRNAKMDTNRNLNEYSLILIFSHSSGAFDKMQCIAHVLYFQCNIIDQLFGNQIVRF